MPGLERGEEFFRLGDAHRHLGGTGKLDPHRRQREVDLGDPAHALARHRDRAPDVETEPGLDLRQSRVRLLGLGGAEMLQQLLEARPVGVGTAHGVEEGAAQDGGIRPRAECSAGEGQLL